MKRVIPGPHGVLEALRASRGGIERIFVEEGPLGKPLAAVVDLANQKGCAVDRCETAFLDALAKGERHQGVVGLSQGFPYVSLDQVLANAAASPFLIALDEITDPHNLGAIIRSAVAFGAHGVLLPEHRSARVTPTVVRASAGATEHAQIVQVTNLSQTLLMLADHGLQTVGLVGEAKDALSDLPSPDAGQVLVVGSEGKGLRRLVRERCQYLARIPMAGPIGSLNASVAAGIALYESTRLKASK